MRQMAMWGVAFLLANAGIARGAQRGGGKTPVPTVTNGSASSSDGKTSSPGRATNPGYLIGPEDVLDVTVWKEPDVSRVVPVRPDGRISLPLINDIQAAGISPEQLAATIAEKLRKFVNEPNVTVIVTAINSQRVFVVGEVL